MCTPGTGVMSWGESPLYETRNFRRWVYQMTRSEREVRDEGNCGRIEQSMNAADNWHDNAFLESCFGKVKTELELVEYANGPEALRELTGYIRRAGASKLGVGEDFQQVAWVEGAVQAFVLDTPFVRLLLPQQTQPQAADGGQVGRAVAILLAA